MSTLITKRVLDESNYIIKTNNTIRETSKYFRVSKSTVHNDMSRRLKNINSKLYDKVYNILSYHNMIKHIRGGNSTKLKYKGKNK